MRFFQALLWSTVSVGLGLCGCEPLGLKAHVTTIKTGPDGNLVVQTREVKNADELHDALNEAERDFHASLDRSAKSLSDTTKALVASLTEAPAAGQVELADLNPKLEPWQGKAQYDFLWAAGQSRDGSYDFSYVQVGVGSYDDFFRAVAETYAYAFQMQHTRQRARLIAGLIVGQPLHKNAKLDEVRSRVADTPPTDQNRAALAHVAQLGQIHDVLAGDSVAVLERTSSLIQRGKDLVAAAPTSITNPKTALHLDLIVQGLRQSIELLHASAQMLGAGSLEVVTPRAGGRAPS